MDPAAAARDARVRLAAFEWLERQVGEHGDVLDWAVLALGFTYRGQRVPLVSQQGIFKPRVLPEMPLSIRTSPDGPYDDHFGPDGLLRYAYRGTDPAHPDNVALRRAMRARVPLVYFHGVVRGRYLAVWPVFVVGDDPGSLTFVVAADDPVALGGLRRVVSGEGQPVAGSPEELGRRRYVTATVRRRLHQRGFRERVLAAYRGRCALCRLGHRELLEAAHIVPEGEPGGEPVVPNGLALCALHHAALDRYLIGVRPDHVVEVHPAVLEETDGPMLRHGLQALHGSRLRAPRSPRTRPDPHRLAWRYERFLEAV